MWGPGGSCGSCGPYAPCVARCGLDPIHVKPIRYRPHMRPFTLPCRGARTLAGDGGGQGGAQGGALWGLRESKNQNRL